MYLVTYRVCKSNQENGIEVSKSFRFFLLLLLRFQSSDLHTIGLLGKKRIIDHTSQRYRGLRRRNCGLSLSLYHAHADRKTERRNVT